MLRLGEWPPRKGPNLEQEGDHRMGPGRTLRNAWRLYEWIQREVAWRMVSLWCVMQNITQLCEEWNALWVGGQEMQKRCKNRKPGASQEAVSGPQPLRNSSDSMAAGLVGCELTGVCFTETDKRLLIAWYCVRKGKQLMGLFNNSVDSIPEAPPPWFNITTQG